MGNAQEICDMDKTQDTFEMTAEGICPRCGDEMELEYIDFDEWYCHNCGWHG